MQHKYKALFNVVSKNDSTKHTSESPSRLLIPGHVKNRKKGC